MNINYSNFNTSLRFGEKNKENVQKVKTYLQNLKEEVEKAGKLDTFKLNVPEQMKKFEDENSTCSVSKPTWIKLAKILGIQMRTWQEAHMEILDKRENDPDFKKRQSQQASERMKKRWKESEYRENHLKLLEEVRSNPANRAKQSALMTELHLDPEFQQKQSLGASKSLKKLHQAEAFKQEHKKRSSKKMKENRQNPEFEAKRTEGLLRYYAGFLVKKVHGNVNRSTGKIIDYADPQGVSPLENAIREETRDAVKQALKALKQADPTAHHIVCKEMGIPTKSASKLPEEPLSDKQKTDYFQKGLAFLRGQLSDLQDF